jgi:4-diphosphocytidyl-2-C-methyl-D-erythritol kinase
MVVFPGTKINLGLHVVEKRPDGFHNIETVYYPVPFTDILEAVRADHFSFVQSGLSLAVSEEENIAVRAYRMMEAHYPVPPLKIHLHKVVPPGSGLGGGSADAAAMIKVVSQLAGLQLSTETMRKHAAALGADCAFFVESKPAVAKGIGDILSPVDLSLKDLYLVVVIPPFSVSTAKAYAEVIPGKPERPLEESIAEKISRWPDILTNDFEATAAVPQEIAAIKKKLYASGASFALMSGSGSAVFGLFEEKPVISTDLFPSGYQSYQFALL